MPGNNDSLLISFTPDCLKQINKHIMILFWPLDTGFLVRHHLKNC